LVEGPDGEERWIVGFNQPYENGPFSKHAEQYIGDNLMTAGVNPSQVKAVYSELEPCVVPNNCAGYLSRMYPNAVVSYSFSYPASDQVARQQSVRSLNNAVGRLFGNE
jgi:hypothetical protein